MTRNQRKKEYKLRQNLGWRTNDEKPKEQRIN